MKVNRSIWKASVITLGCLPVVASCGRVRDDEGTYIATTDLSNALLNIGDLPPGWAETQRDLFDVRQPENPSIDESLWCPEVASSAQKLSGLAGDSGADVEMELRGGSGVGVALRLQAWSNEDVKKYFSFARQMVEQCDNKTWSSDNVVYSAKLVDGLQVGDEILTWQIDIKGNTSIERFSSSNRTTMVRFGAVLALMQFGHNTTASSMGAFDEVLWTRVAKAAMKRLEDRLP